MLGADALASVGTGLTLPFLMVYLHAVRGLGLGVAGAATATVALAGLLGNPVGGMWSDRFGPRRVLAAGWVTAAVGACAIALVSKPWEAFAAAALSGLGAALALPAQDTLLGVLVPESERSGAYAVRHTTLNLGLGLGGLVAAAVADVARPSSFVLLYALDALSFVVAALLLWWAAGPRTVALRPAGEVGDDAAGLPPAGGYRTVLRDRRFVRLWVLTAVLVAVGFAQFASVFPVLVTRSGAGAAVVGLAFAANTATVTAAQLVVLRLARGRRRTTAIVMLCALWVLSWTLVLVGTGLGAGSAAVFVLAAVTFALGETLFAPTVPALTNSIAPAALRGRYNGAAAFAYTAGFAAGPAVAGILLERGRTGALLVGLAAGCAVAALLAASMRSGLPRAADVIDAPPPAVHDPAADAPAVADRQEACA